MMTARALLEIGVDRQAVKVDAAWLSRPSRAPPVWGVHRTMPTSAWAAEHFCSAVGCVAAKMSFLQRQCQNGTFADRTSRVTANPRFEALQMIHAWCAAQVCLPLSALPSRIPQSRAPCGTGAACSMLEENKSTP